MPSFSRKASHPQQRPSPQGDPSPPTAEGSSGRTEHRGAPFVVVGLGASAGGLEACRRFLTTMPKASRLALVLIQHMDPDRDSMLRDLLQRTSAFPVVQASDGVKILPGHLYVNPPGSLLQLDGGQLSVEHPEQPRENRTPIDHFLESLAEVCGPDAVAVVLSGTGQDGSAGVEAVHAQGGLCIAQDPQTARHDGMPLSALATGRIDHVLPPEEIPRILVEYGRHRDVLRHSGSRSRLEGELDEHLDSIVGALDEQTGRRFQAYKTATLRRRILRRITALHLDSAEAYLERIHRDPEEAERLLQELTIGVTRFFRNPEAFATLEREALEPLVRSKEPGDAIRVWVIGCSTGQEAYSVAMLLHEHTKRSGRSCKIQIFASDIDAQALELARTGLYPATIESELPPELLETYFSRQEDGYSVDKQLRESVLFSLHDLIQDPPFSRLDLITCRNVLIYLERGLQRKIMPVLHHVLRPRGFLFLGMSEGISRYDQLFEAIDPGQRLFRKREVKTSEDVRFPLYPSTHGSSKARDDEPDRPPRPSDRSVERIVLQEFSPPALVVTETGEVVQVITDPSFFLRIPQGAPSQNLFHLIHTDLRTALRRGLERAVDTARQVELTDLPLQVEGRLHRVAATLKPLPVSSPKIAREASAYYLVVLRVERSESLAPAQAGDEDSDDPQVARLQRELHTSQEHLQATVDELEASRDELRSSNEELTSVNEQLQTSNEELSTSSEELQTVNEELETVNDELEAKVQELGQINADLRNLFESTRIATIFLTPELRIQNFTPAVQDIFPIREPDVGRPITDLSSNLAYPTREFLEDMRRVLETSDPFETQVVVSQSYGREDSPVSSQWYSLRIFPYWTLEGETAGLTLTLVDISEIKEAEREIVTLNRELYRKLAELEATLDLIPIGIAIAEDPSCQEIRVNQFGAEILQIPADANVSPASPERPTLGYRTCKDGVELALEDLPIYQAATTGEHIHEECLQVLYDDGTQREVEVSAVPLRSPDGPITGALVAYLDITEENRQRREIERRARQQTAIAHLSLEAISTTRVDEVLEAAIRTIIATLEVEIVKFLELEPETRLLQLRAGHGWDQEQIGQLAIPVDAPGSQAAHAFRTGNPVVVQDLDTDPRFDSDSVLKEQGAQSGLTVLLSRGSDSWGVLGVHSRRKRQFVEDDIAFAQAVANIVTAVVERNRMRDELAHHAARDRLMRSERLASLGTLAVGIAHEINNPINSISLTTEIAQRALARGNLERLSQDLAIILEESIRCGEIVTNVLDFVRETRTTKSPRDLNQVVRRAVEIASKDLEDSLDLTLSLAEDLPPVPMNSTEIEQVVTNLLRNAVEASAPEPVRVTLRTTETLDGVGLEVADDGPGIPPHQLVRIFDPFFTTRRDRGGVGLGLSLSHEIIVERHGGKIDAWSQPQQGTRFRIELPTDPETPEDPEATPAPEALGSTPPLDG